MTEPETTNEAEVETDDFTDELSDEALDRDGVGSVWLSCPCCCSNN